MDDGSKVTLGPPGATVAVRSIDWAAPPVTVVLTVAVADCPGRTLALAGSAAIEKSSAGVEASTEVFQSAHPMASALRSSAVMLMLPG